MLPLHTFIEDTKPGLKDNMIGSVFMTAHLSMFGSPHPPNISDGHNMSHNEVIVAAVVHSLNAHIIKCYYYYCCILWYFSEQLIIYMYTLILARQSIF